MRRNKPLRIGLAALLVLGSAGCAHAPPSKEACVLQSPNEVPNYRPEYCSYPADVRLFLDDRDWCDYWAGEWPDVDDRSDWAVERRKFLEKKMKSCSGIDHRLHNLKASYAQDPRILEVLNE